MSILSIIMGIIAIFAAAVTVIISNSGVQKSSMGFVTISLL